MRPEDFSRELSFYRAKNGLTQKELAQALRVSDRSVKMWEAGTSLPRKAVRIQLAQTFGLSPIYFLQEEELPKSASAPPPIHQELTKLYKELSLVLEDSKVSDDVKKSLSEVIESTIREHEF